MKLNPGRWLIVHYRDVHKLTWQKSIPPTYDVEYCGYKSLHHKKGKSYIGVILDEAHHVTETTIKSLKEISFQYGLALSALIPAPKKALLTSWQRHGLNRIPIVQAIKKGLLPIPKILACPVEMKDEPTEVYDVNRKGPKAPWVTVPYEDYMNKPVLHTRFANYHVTCSERQYYNLLNGDILFWKNNYLEEKKEWQYIKWQRLAGDRKKFIARMKQRTFIAVHNHILTLDKRFLTFGADFDQIALVTTENVVSYKNTKYNHQLILDFNEGRIRRIYSSDILNESLNLVEVDVVLLGALNTIQVANFQRFGRALRGDFPILVVPYVKATTDEKNFQKFVTGLESFVITTNTLGKVKSSI